MLREVGWGLAAGAVGTLALEATTFLDMLVRGRPPSDLPARAAGRLADGAGVDLGPEDTGVAANRRNALGSLMGHLTGLGVGAAYGIVRGRQPVAAWPLAGLVTGLTAKAASDVPATLSGLTDPRKWGVSGWLGTSFPTSPTVWPPCSPTRRSPTSAADGGRSVQHRLGCPLAGDHRALHAGQEPLAGGVAGPV